MGFVCLGGLLLQFINQICQAGSPNELAAPLEFSKYCSASSAGKSSSLVNGLRVKIHVLWLVEEPCISIKLGIKIHLGMIKLLKRIFFDWLSLEDKFTNSCLGALDERIRGNICIC